MKEKSILKNVILNVIRVSLSIIFPLITFPYISRVLMAENLGKVNYALSIENYFALLAALGINTYAIREGARRRNNPEQLSIFVNEIFTVNLITTFFAYVFMFIVIAANKALHPYALLIGLQSLSILFTTIGVDWINSIFEDYLYITVRGLIVQALSLGLMFLWVKTPDDYYLYAMLTVFSNGLCGVLNFFYSRRYVKIHLIRKCQFLRHIKKLLIFFANNLAMNVYLNSDITMLGYIEDDYVVGIYSVVVKIYNVIKAIIAALFTVCIPRLSAYYGNGCTKEYKNLVNTTVGVCTLLVFPSVTGLILLAQPIVLIISGKAYIQAASSLSIIAVGIIGAIYGGIFTNCINIPMKREKYNLEATVLAAVINVILNFAAIPIWKENGAAITSIIAEFTVLIYCVVTNKEFWNIIDKSFLAPNIAASLLETVAIILLYILIRMFVSNIYIYMILLVVMSAFSYAFLLLLTKNTIFINLAHMVCKKKRNVH